MEKFSFDRPPVGDAADISADCQRQLLSFINEIVKAAVAAGWNREDVLLAMVELSWDMYEKRRGDL